VTINDAKRQSREYVTQAAERVLAGTATPAEVEAVALWAKNTAHWMQRMAERSEK
jgi:hypothetical protein